MRRRAAAGISTHGWAILTIVLAVGYAYIGATSPLPSIRFPALAGGLLVLVALRLAERAPRISLPLLVVGAVIPVITGWWSLVVPLTGLLILACGTLAVRNAEPRTPLASSLE